MSYRPTVDVDACTAHGICDAIAPDVFAVDEVAHVIGVGPDELILEAARACPSVAITVHDEAGRQIFP